MQLILILSGTLCPGHTGIAATTCLHGPLRSFRPIRRLLAGVTWFIFVRGKKLDRSTAILKKNFPRTNIDHTDGIHQAFFNGAGFESWENVWGVWNGITERDGELLRRVATILR